MGSPKRNILSGVAAKYPRCLATGIGVLVVQVSVRGSYCSVVSKAMSPRLPPMMYILSLNTPIAILYFASDIGDLVVQVFVDGSYSSTVEKCVEFPSGLFAPPKMYIFPAAAAARRPQTECNIGALEVHVSAAGSYSSTEAVPPCPPTYPPMAYILPFSATLAEWLLDCCIGVLIAQVNSPAQTDREVAAT